MQSRMTTCNAEAKTKKSAERRSQALYAGMPEQSQQKQAASL
ncbi:PsiF family protein [Advenella sp. FME57]